ncbi:hypothetical protein EVA_03449 [gut metagenome]|uniref:Uncharacterized protein n=1 Tax=gut metagenome TaxID=749906 RepID=J9H3Z7_9ZZZZ
MLLTDTTDRTNPIFRNIFKCGTWRNATIWITYFRVIYPITRNATIFIHIL